jgi:hypothetical protein
VHLCNYRYRGISTKDWIWLQRSTIECTEHCTPLTHDLTSCVESPNACKPMWAPDFQVPFCRVQAGDKCKAPGRHLCMDLGESTGIYRTTVQELCIMSPRSDLRSSGPCTVLPPNFCMLAWPGNSCEEIQQRRSKLSCNCNRFSFRFW